MSQKVIFSVDSLLPFICSHDLHSTSVCELPLLQNTTLITQDVLLYIHKKKSAVSKYRKNKNTKYAQTHKGNIRALFGNSTRSDREMYLRVHHSLQRVWEVSTPPHPKLLPPANFRPLISQNISFPL